MCLFFCNTNLKWCDSTWKPKRICILSTNEKVVTTHQEIKRMASQSNFKMKKYILPLYMTANSATFAYECHQSTRIDIFNHFKLHDDDDNLSIIWKTMIRKSTAKTSKTALQYIVTTSIMTVHDTLQPRQLASKYQQSTGLAHRSDQWLQFHFGKHKKKNRSHGILRKWYKRWPTAHFSIIPISFMTTDERQLIDFSLQQSTNQVQSSYWARFHHECCQFGQAEHQHNHSRGGSKRNKMTKGTSNKLHSYYTFAIQNGV